MSDHAGRYIVIEGNDGTGKSTQAELLAEWLRANGAEVHVVEEPGSDDEEKSTPVANELRAAIKNGELQRSPEINLLLFSAARRELWQQRIASALERVLWCSRHGIVFSTLAYQGRGEGLEEAEIVRVTRLFTDERYMAPDLMIVLVTDDAARQARIAERGELENPDTFESRRDDFQDAVNQHMSNLQSNTACQLSTRAVRLKRFRKTSVHLLRGCDIA